MHYKRGAAVGLVATGGASYAAYELSDTVSPLSYSLEVPIVPTLEHSEDIYPSVNSSNENNPKTENTGAQRLQSNSMNVMTSLPNTSSAVDSNNPQLEKEKNRNTDAVESPPEVSRPAKGEDAPVVQTKVIAAVNPTTQPTVATAEPARTTTPTMKPTAQSNPTSQKAERSVMQTKLLETHKTLASSYGLTQKDSYDAKGLDDYNGDPNSGVRVKTFVVGEDANYMKNLWTNSIAIKHRKYWNLAPDDDPIWDQQLASAQKRIKWHSDHNGNMYAYVFGSFSLHKNGSWTHLTKKSLAQRCKQNLERTPWGTWWSAARARYWSLLWDFCAKPTEQAKGIPWNIDYWYRYQIGDRKG